MGTAYVDAQNLATKLRLAYDNADPDVDRSGGTTLTSAATTAFTNYTTKLLQEISYEVACWKKQAGQVNQTYTTNTN